MTGEISIFGVFVPALLALAVIAIILTGLTSRILAAFGAYRIIIYRPLVDVAIFVIILGVLASFTRTLQ